MKAKLQLDPATNQMRFISQPKRRKPARTAEERKARKAELQRDRQRLHRERAKNGGADVEVNDTPLGITIVPDCSECGKRLIDCTCPAPGAVRLLRPVVVMWNPATGERKIEQR